MHDMVLQMLQCYRVGQCYDIIYQDLKCNDNRYHRDVM